MKKYLVILAVVVMAFAPIVAGAADLRSNILQKFSIGPVTVTNNDNTTGATIDTLNYDSLTYVIVSGTLADSDVTLTPTIYGCPTDNCDAGQTALTGTKLVGTIAGATFAASDDNTVKSIGVNPSFRYNRIVITPANNTGNAPFSVIGILGHPKLGATQ